MADRQVKCVNTRGNSHEHITHLGGGPGAWGPWTLDQVVLAIEAKTDTFYTVDGVNRVGVYVRTTGTNGKKFVQTYADNDWKNNLLSLPRCVG
jgi:hypothetical protein